MKQITIAMAVVVLASTFVIGQDHEKGSIFGGYQYMSVGTQGVERQSMNGWNADAQVNPTAHLGLAADISGVYHGDFLGLPGVTAHIYNYLFGPRVYGTMGKAQPFGEVLFGFDRVGLTRNGVSATNTSFAMAAGGGLDVNVGPHVGVRVFKIDYLLDRAPLNVLGITNNTNNIRLATGIKLRF